MPSASLVSSSLVRVARGSTLTPTVVEQVSDAWIPGLIPGLIASVSSFWRIANGFTNKIRYRTIIDDFRRHPHLLPLRSIVLHSNGKCYVLLGANGTPVPFNDQFVTEDLFQLAANDLFHINELVMLQTKPL